MPNIQQAGQKPLEQVSSGAVKYQLADIKPTVAEINHLWTAYFGESQLAVLLKHMAAHSKDPDYHSVLQQELDLASNNIKIMEDLYKAIQHPIPDAFGEKDVDINAPLLFHETYSVRYIRLLLKFFLQNHILAFSECTRPDFRQLFSGFINGSKEVIKRADEVLLAKGVFPKPPYIVTPDSLDFVHDKAYYGSIFGDARSINALEISNIFELLDFKITLHALKVGFAQVVKSDEIRKYLNQGLGVSNNQIKALISILEKEGLPGPELVDYQVTDSQQSPYSDRFILYHYTVIVAYILLGYGVGLSRITRKDILATYTRLMAQIISFSEHGTDLLVKNGWFEKIPETADRQKLTH